MRIRQWDVLPTEHTTSAAGRGAPKNAPPGSV